MSRRDLGEGISLGRMMASLGLAFALAAVAGCGKKGAPVPPARPVAAPAPSPEATLEKEQPQVEERRRIQPLLPP